MFHVTIAWAGLGKETLSDCTWAGMECGPDEGKQIGRLTGNRWPPTHGTPRPATWSRPGLAATTARAGYECSPSGR
jgi:hypothetical protein